MSLTNGPNLGLVVDGLPGEEHYEAITRRWRALDAFVFCRVLDKDLTVPPGSPADGDTYIVAGSATGGWLAQDTKLAVWSTKQNAWEFHAPREGWFVWVADEDFPYTWTGTVWLSHAGFGSAAKLAADSDTGLTADSNTRLPTQAAVKAYVNSLISGGSSNIMMFKGVINCSGNPDYPAGDAGHVWKVGTAGKIGGASGPNVETGDTLVCIVDGSLTGNHATVGANWAILQTNLDGAVTGPSGAVNLEIALFDGTTGRLIKSATGDGYVKVAAGVYAVRTAAQVRTDIGEVVTAVTDSGGTVSINAALGNGFRVTLGANATLANPSNPNDGQVINFRFNSAGFALTFGSKYKFPSGVTPALSPTGNRDFMSCQYDANDDSWFCVMNRAFA